MNIPALRDSRNKVISKPMNHLQRLISSFRKLQQVLKTDSLSLAEVRFLITDNDETLICFIYDKIMILRNPYNYWIYLSSIEKSINAYRDRPTVLSQFVNSFTFYEELRLIDKNLPAYGTIYILRFEDRKVFKVGRTFKIEDRYNLEIMNRLVKLIYVSDDKNVEQILLAKIRSSGYKNAKDGREYFYYTNFEKVMQIFDSVVIPKKINVMSKNPHINRSVFSLKHQGYWCTLTAMRVIDNHYILEPSTRQLFLDVEQAIVNTFSSNIFFRFMHDVEPSLNFKLCRFKGYLIIHDMNDMYVNMDKLWKTVKRADGSDNKKSLYDFIRSKRVQDHLKPQFEELFPHMPLVREYNITGKWKILSGRYMHGLFVHFILEDLDANYALLVALYMFNTFIINGASIPDLSRQHKLKQYYQNYKREMNMKELYNLLYIL